MNDGSFRIAVVGAGRMGRVHIAALERSDNVDVAAVVEPVESARAEIAAGGVPTFATVGELLSDREIDGALIAAPTDRHVELVETLAGAGVPILCEKPVGTRAADATAAAATVAHAGIPFQVGYWRRFVPALGALRERIVAGDLGEILQISCLQWDAEPPSAQFRAHSGGIVVDMAVHEFDQARWLTGQDVASVVAMSGGGGEPAADPDVAAIAARLTGGTLLTVSVGRIFPEGDCCWVEVFGSAGYERIPFIWGPPTALGDDVFHAALIAQAEAFADAVRGGGDAARIAAGAADAVAALSAAELAAAALRNGGGPV
ncbi:MAG TPA: Gfo/Idh/MocA family oxidoreductase [Solirubrobacteraceae bacterium]|nr:Gfo/Idh/MocA family oxidoreductase [Solirubrobacteraceae bacterium]